MTNTDPTRIILILLSSTTERAAPSSRQRVLVTGFAGRHKNANNNQRTKQIQTAFKHLIENDFKPKTSESFRLRILVLRL
ncbi:hypothetical protein DdX_15297 [Ditylenchus destructor]|uniref:Uncharacterized protein n=1 Tax=Ditylenchus destructor TaxID=166010 RepID=A0AAD4MQP2_9BILA|nr:hypothetical protein DdX_15297 [Ditylenchus destructor]